LSRELKILIVGQNSSVGREIAKHFSAKAKVVFGGRSTQNRIDLLSNTDDTILIPQNTDIVINCAALFSNKTSLEIAKSTHVNIVGPLRLLNATQEAGVSQFIQISSIFASMPNEIVEKSAYALQKRTVDDLLHLAANNGPTQVVSLRPSALYGPYGFQSVHQPFLESILNKAAEGEDIVFSGRNDVYRNYLHVFDFATIVWETIQFRLGGIYECPGTNYSYSQIARLAINTFGTKSKISFDQISQTYEDKILPSMDTSFYHRIGFEPRIDLETAMSIYLSSRPRASL
jgi:nucleoside-diphosphate-sugar epimerase